LDKPRFGTGSNHTVSRRRGRYREARAERSVVERNRGGYRPQLSRRMEPQPVGDRCSPTCPLFVCTKKCLMVKLESGKPVAYCLWANDKCIGASCQYASCRAHSLLPDGRCAHALRRSRREEPSFEEEVMRVEARASSVRSLISRRGLDKDLESEIF